MLYILSLYSEKCINMLVNLALHFVQAWHSWNSITRVEKHI